MKFYAIEKGLTQGKGWLTDKYVVIDNVDEVARKFHSIVSEIKGTGAANKPWWVHAYEVRPDERGLLVMGLPIETLYHEKGGME